MRRVRPCTIKKRLTVMGFWIFQLIFLLFAIVGLWGLINVHKKWKKIIIEENEAGI